MHTESQQYNHHHPSISYFPPDFLIHVYTCHYFCLSCCIAVCFSHFQAEQYSQPIAWDPSSVFRYVESELGCILRRTFSLNSSKTIRHRLMINKFSVRKFYSPTWLYIYRKIIFNLCPPTRPAITPSHHHHHHPWCESFLYEHIHIEIGKVFSFHQLK